MDKDILWKIYLHARRRNPQEAVNVTISLAHLKQILSPSDLLVHIDWLIHSHNRRLDMLARPFPSAPLHPAKYELKITRDDGAFHLNVYSAVYAARKFLDIIIDNRKTSWIDRRTIRCHDLTIKSPHMERMMTYEYTPEEEAWLLPMPYAYNARKIAFNEVHTGAPETPPESAGHDRMSKRERRLQARAARSKGNKIDRLLTPEEKSTELSLRAKEKPHFINSGNYGIPELTKATGMDPSKLRKWLRNNEIKPAAGWVWDEADYNRLVKKLGK